MDFDSKIFVTGLIFFLTVAINLPFGYFRKRAKRFSFKWFLYIHIPIPLILLARVLSHLDYRYIPIFLMAAVIGQFLGGRVEF